MFDKYILILITVSFLFLSCSTDSGTAYETAIDISFIDQNGQDLLDPANEIVITEQNTDLYYLVDDSLMKQYEGHLDHPKMFFVSDEKSWPNDNYFLRVFSNIIEGKSTTFSYLEFEGGSMDTIKTQYEIGDNSTVVTKVWYNGDLKCDVYDKKNPDLESTKYGGCYFIITKDWE
jgi:hypothetical protein